MYDEFAPEEFLLSGEPEEDLDEDTLEDDELDEESDNDTGTALDEEEI